MDADSIAVVFVEDDVGKSPDDRAAILFICKLEQVRIRSNNVEALVDMPQEAIAETGALPLVPCVRRAASSRA